MRPEPQDKPTKDESTLPPIKDWESAPKLPPDHWIYKGGPQITSVGGLGQSTESPKKSSEVINPVKRGEPLTQEQWDRLLKEAGWRDGTLDPAGPTAFELPGFPNSQPKQD